MFISQSQAHCLALLPICSVTVGSAFKSAITTARFEVPRIRQHYEGL